MAAVIEVSEFVLDCSVSIAWLLADESTDHTNALLAKMANSRAWVPPLWRTEVANALRSAFRSGRITWGQAQANLGRLMHLDIQVSADELGRMPPVEILEFAHQHDLSAYDAGYLYIAKQMRLPLATLDKNLRRAAASAKIKLL